MKYPALRSNPSYRVNIPALSGGVNLQDDMTLTRDNQLTDCCNLWWKDGSLRTRPGLHGGYCAHWTYAETSVKKEFVYTDLYDDSGRYAVQALRDEVNNTTFYAPQHIASDGSMIRAVGLGMTVYGADHPPHFLLAKPPQSAEEEVELYGYTVDGNGAAVFCKKRNDNAWGRVEPYIPTVLINGGERGSGTLYEGYNLLSGRFRCRFTTGEELSRFYLPQKELTASLLYPVEITYLDNHGNTVTFTVSANAVNTAYSDGVRVGDTTVYARVDYKNGLVDFWKSTDSTADSNRWTPPDAGVNNNLDIVAFKENKTAIEKICDMGFCTWFGGTSSLAGGTRLFVAGHPQYPGLVCWSDVNNPLYFPENNYAYVGNSGEAVTAFGKQSDMLVIFKQNSVYAMTYAEGASYTAADLTDGKVVDVTAVAAVFPIQQLHPSIGCDRPDTLVLCQNRLVWATSDGQVHMLLSANAYSDRNIRELGRQVQRRLKTAMQNADTAMACAYEGRYLLLVGHEMFVLDYTDMAYTRYASFENERSAQKALPWYIWHGAPTGVRFECLFSQNGHVCLCGMAKAEAGSVISVVLYTLEGETDSEPYYSGDSDKTVVRYDACPIESRFCTKVFDFGQPERRKQIAALYLKLGGADNSRVSVSYLTEKGTVQDVRDFAFYGNEPYTPTAFGRYRLTPRIGRVTDFGLQVTGSGAIGIGGISLHYTLLGGVR